MLLVLMTPGLVQQLFLHLYTSELKSNEWWKRWSASRYSSPSHPAKHGIFRKLLKNNIPNLDVPVNKHNKCCLFLFWQLHFIFEFLSYIHYQNAKLPLQHLNMHSCNSSSALISQIFFMIFSCFPDQFTYRSKF